jgi:hypothetical protein
MERSIARRQSAAPRMRSSSCAAPESAAPGQRAVRARRRHQLGDQGALALVNDHERLPSPSTTAPTSAAKRACVNGAARIPVIARAREIQLYGLDRGCRERSDRAIPDVPVIEEPVHEDHGDFARAAARGSHVLGARVVGGAPRMWSPSSSPHIAVHSSLGRRRRGPQDRLRVAAMSETYGALSSRDGGSRSGGMRQGR